MSIISQFSKYIVLPIFMEWLATKDLCQIDTSNCNHTERDRFLALIKSENVKFDRPGDHLSDRYLDWITARNISIVRLTITREPKSFKKAVGLCQCLIHLEVLDVLKDTVKIRKCFLFILSSCSKLEVLHLNTCEVLDDATLKAIANNCPNLKDISFPCLGMAQKTISDAGWLLLTEKCTKLEILVVRNMFMSPVVLNAINTNCLNLKEFSLIQASQDNSRRPQVQIKFNGVDWKIPTKLRLLRLVGHYFDEKSLTSIIRSCPLLEILDISRSTAIMDSLVNLPTCCPLLTELNVNSSQHMYYRWDTICVAMSAIVELILRDCKELRKFYANSYNEEIPWCKYVSSAPNLIELGLSNFKYGYAAREIEKLSKMEHLKIVYEVPAVFECDN